MPGATSVQIEHVGDEKSTNRAGPGPPTSTRRPSSAVAGQGGRSLTDRGSLGVDLERAARAQPEMERPDLPRERHDDRGEHEHQAATAR